MNFAEAIGWVSTSIAVTGVLLNNRRRRACFLVWMVSNTLSAAIHLAAGMYALTTRDAIFFVLAIHGWACWGVAPGWKNGQGQAEKLGPLGKKGEKALEAARPDEAQCDSSRRGRP